MIGALHAAARKYAELGMPVFPLQPRGKEPVTASGCLQATIDTAVIDRWWNTAPDMNVAIATGGASGVFVVDVDDDIGEATMREIERANGALPSTVESLTGRGRHIWFRLGEHEPVHNSAGKIGLGVDIRGNGGYCVVPPSVHPTGRKYKWSVDSASNFATSPDWLHAILANNTGGKGRPLEEWHDALTQPIANGTRNNTLAEICGKLLFHDVNLVLIRDLLVCVNAARCDPPIDTREVEAIVASVARTHFKNRDGDHG